MGPPQPTGGGDRSSSSSLGWLMFGENAPPIPNTKSKAPASAQGETTEVEDEPSATPLDEDGIESDPDVMCDDVVELSDRRGREGSAEGALALTLRAPHAAGPTSRGVPWLLGACVDGAFLHRLQCSRPWATCSSSSLGWNSCTAQLQANGLHRRGLFTALGWLGL
ncbi:hypothetical protein EJB05_26735, partial [Eragrostis curvula]